MSELLPPLEWDPDAIQLKGFSRSVAEIQWLLVALVLLYLLLTEKESVYSDFPVLVATAVYFVFSLVLNVLGMLDVSRRWLLALNTWLMTAFITWLLYAIDGINGPLVSLYLLPVITSALALGRVATLLQVAVVAACYLLLLYYLKGDAAFIGQGTAVVTAHVLMFLLVGYLTTVLADAIHFANERFRVLAHTDQLTGLYNRVILHTMVLPLFAGTIRDKRPFSVMVIDLDDLKVINDDHGHEAGDEAIVACAKILKKTLRESDIVVRQGGDEFAAFLPNTRSEEAAALAHRLFSVAEKTQIHGVKLQMSVGIASFPEHSDSINGLLSQADAAMYDAKRSGGQSIAVHKIHQPAFQSEAG